MLLTLAKLRIKNGKLLADLENINQAVTAINKTRSTLIHGQWFMANPAKHSVTISRVSADGKINWKQPKTFTAKKVHEWTQYTLDACGCLAFFTVNVEKGKRAVTPQSLGKPPQ